jgi:NTP pyrophosphatase (non-canonical NTP hydrolase)
MLNRIGREFMQHSGYSCDDLALGLKRAQEEMDEAAKAVSDPHQCVEEMADVILTLAALCRAAGLDLDTHVYHKHQINLARRWAPHPTIPGAVKHIKPE